MHIYQTNIERLQVIRNLAVSSFGIFTRDGALREEFDNFGDYESLQDLHRRAREVFDRYKHLVEAMSEDMSPASANETAETFMDYVLKMKNLLEQQRLNFRDIAFRKKLEETGNSVFPTSDLKEVSVHELLDRSRKFPQALAKILNAPLVYLYCLEFALSVAPRIYRAVQEPSARIIRELRFPPEYQQAGIGILSYFSVVLKEKCPNVAAEVSIKQLDDVVTMIISFPDGRQEEVAQTLSEFSKVVTGQMTPKEFLADDINALALQQKLDIAHLEIRQASELQKLKDEHYSNRIVSLEKEVERLYFLLDRELNSRDHLQEYFIKVHASLIEDRADIRLLNLISELAKAISVRDIPRTEVILKDISDNEPDLFAKISLFIWGNATGGVVGNAVYDWLKVIWPILPH